MLKQYIEDYQKGFEFSFCERFTQEIGGVLITVEVWLYENFERHERRQKARVTMEKGDAVYQCECVDDHDWKRMVYPLVIDGKTVLCFRKTLYGFTFLDAETLEEVYDYFPSEVTEGQESFIMVDAVMFHDLILFSGCYWAWPYWSVAYDHQNKRFLNLCDVSGIYDDALAVESGEIVLTGRDDEEQKVTVTLTYDEVKTQLAAQGTPSFTEPSI